MRMNYCVICGHLYITGEMKLGICLDCWDKINSGIDPTFTKFLELDLENIHH